MPWTKLTTVRGFFLHMENTPHSIIFSMSKDCNGDYFLSNNIGQYIMPDILLLIYEAAFDQYLKISENIQEYERANEQIKRDHFNDWTCFINSGNGKNTRKPISKRIRKIIIETLGDKCLKCGTGENIVIDHIVPVSNGGGNDIENLQPLCKKCNHSKFTKTIDYRKQ